MKAIRRNSVFLFLSVMVLSLSSGIVQAETIVSPNRLNVTCGNGICELGENIYNCPIDCATQPISIKTTFINPVMYPNQQKNFTLDILNIMDSPLDVELFHTGSLFTFSTLTEKKAELGPRESKSFELMVSIPEIIKPGIYSGNIDVRSGSFSNVMTLSLIVTNQKKSSISLSLDIITDRIRPNQPLKFDEEIIVTEKGEINLTLLYELFNEGEFITSWSEKNEISGILVRGRNVTLANLTEGNYMLRISALDHNIASTAASFMVIIPFWNEKRIRTAVLVGVFLILLSAMYFAHNKYIKWRMENLRYLLPRFDLLPKKGPRALNVGKIPETTKKAYIDPDSLTTHALVAGSTGSGKSVSASVIIEEVLLQGIPVVVFDPTSQWTGFVKQCTDNNILRFFPEFSLKEDDARSFKGIIYNVTSPDVSLDFKKYMIPGEITIFNLNALKAGEYDQAVLHIIDTMFQIPWDESPELKMVLVFDEVHRLLEKYGGKGGYIALEKACREFRKWGIGLIMVSQVNADFKQAVAGNILTEVQLNTKSMEDIEKISQKYGPEYSSKVTRQGIGVAMIQNPKYNEGKPWFVHFRPTLHNPHKIPEEELLKYAEYSTKIDEYQQKINMLKDKGLNNANSLELDLKLAKDKLKEGHFKMVDIYIKSIGEEISNH